MRRAWSSACLLVGVVLHLSAAAASASSSVPSQSEKRTWVRSEAGVSAFDLDLSSAFGDSEYDEIEVGEDVHLRSPWAEGFAAWEAAFNRSYASGVERAARARVWAKHEMFIAAHNAKPGVGYTLGHNAFSDMTHREFSMRLGLVVPPGAGGAEEEEDEEVPAGGWFGAAAAAAVASVKWWMSPGVLPSVRVDWREKGAVTGVKDQGQCGSCWAFSTTGSVEGAHAVETGRLQAYSEQELVDCSPRSLGTYGCQGGLMDRAFEWLEGHVLVPEEAYPYEARETGYCNTNLTTNVPGIKVLNFEDVTPNDVLALLRAVEDVGPVSVAVDAGSPRWMMYKSGVYEDPVASGTLNHGVLAVGYTLMPPPRALFGPSYIVVKNSWGSSWGEDGYIRLRVSLSPWADERGTCGIAMMPSYPVTENADAK